MKLTSGYLTYDGVWDGPDGRRHTIHRMTCAPCGEVLSESHQGCCGHGSSGWGKGPHTCKETI